MFLPFKKATLLIPSGPNHDPTKKHLFVIITDPIKYPENSDELKVLLCPICSIKPRQFYDQSCVIYPNEHPFINRKSYVAYKYTRIETVNKLNRGVKQEKLQPLSPVSEELFNKIVQGLEKSDFVPQKIITFYYYYQINQK